MPRQFANTKSRGVKPLPHSNHRRNPAYEKEPGETGLFGVSWWWVVADYLAAAASSARTAAWA
jgi:hypothetical protein